MPSFARDLGVLPYARWKQLAQEVVELRKMLSALRRTVLDAAQFRTRPRVTILDARVTKPEEATEPGGQSTNQRVRTSVLMTLTESLTHLEPAQPGEAVTPRARRWRIRA